MDVLRTAPCTATPCGYEIVTHGGRTRTGIDALAWAKKGEALGAGELVVNSIDADGTKAGYEITLTRMIAEGGAHSGHCLGRRRNAGTSLRVLTEGKADAALIASILHYKEYTVRAIKQELRGRGIKVTDGVGRIYFSASLF